MESTPIQKINTLLKGIETGDPESVTVVNENVYIQHNPHTQEGNVGLATLFKKLSQTSPKVTMVRGFQDQDFVFAHMEYLLKKSFVINHNQSRLKQVTGDKTLTPIHIIPAGGPFVGHCLRPHKAQDEQGRGGVEHR